MRIAHLGLGIPAAALLLSACGGGGVFGRDRPDEFAVARSAPLVIPPDFGLQPPRPGEPAAQGAAPSQQALDALFGGPAPRSQGERSMLEAAGNERVALGARSVVADPKTSVVDKGPLTQAIIAAPAGAGREATASTPQ